MDTSKRDKVLELVRKLLLHTVKNGCTPGEAAKFAAKAAELMEQWQIEETELRMKSGGATFSVDDVEVCQNELHTGKKVFNPGMSAVICGLATGHCCRVIMFNRNGEAIYGIIGDRVDADYVCQVATSVVPALQISARLEGAEHGYEKAALIRWMNNYLNGAGIEIQNRIYRERMERSAAKEHNAASTGTALMIITGESIAKVKREATEEMFRKAYPKTRTVHSRTTFDSVAHERGREAGKRVGLHVGINGDSNSGHLGSK